MRWVLGSLFWRWGIAKNREAWHATDYGLAKSWTWLSNWTTTIRLRKVKWQELDDNSGASPKTITPNPAFSPILLLLSPIPFTSLLGSVRQITLIRFPSGNWREQESFKMGGNDEICIFFLKRIINTIWPFWKDPRLNCWWWEALISVREILYWKKKKKNKTSGNSGKNPSL